MTTKKQVTSDDDKPDLNLVSAGYVLLADAPYLNKVHRDTISLIDYQLENLRNGVSYSYLNELEINDQVLKYANICIKVINQLQEAGLIGWQNYPSQHYFLRQYRDNAHHNKTENFRPYQTENGYEFYIWPVLTNCGVDERYPVWAKNVSNLNLQSLLNKNQDYLQGLILESKARIQDSGNDIKFRSVYPMAAMGGGIISSDGSSENWDLC